jgi:ABC-type phosphate transport system auxiliary subunit
MKTSSERSRKVLNPGRLECRPAPLDRRQRDRLHDFGLVRHWMDGSDWFWMTAMMVFWIALVGVVVYVAVQAARRADPKS